MASIRPVVARPSRFRRGLSGGWGGEKFARSMSMSARVEEPKVLGCWPVAVAAAAAVESVDC